MSYVLIHPGETEYDLERRVQGTIDLPLTAQGRIEVDQAIEQLRSLELDVIFCAPGEPAYSTARLIGRALDWPVKPLEELDNMHFGLWQGRQFEEIRRRQPKVFRQWQESPLTVCPPQGEPLEEVYSRVAEALRKPLKRGVSFAVVVSEPVCSIAACILRSEEPHLANALQRSSNLVEVIEPVGVAQPGSKPHNTRTFRGLTFGLF